MEALRADIALQISKRHHPDTDSDSFGEELLRPAKRSRYDQKQARSAAAIQPMKSEPVSEISSRDSSPASSATLVGDLDRRTLSFSPTKLSITSESSDDDSISELNSNDTSDESSSEDDNFALFNAVAPPANETESSSSTDSSSPSDSLPSFARVSKGWKPGDCYRTSADDSSSSDGKTSPSNGVSLLSPHQHPHEADNPSLNSEEESSTSESSSDLSSDSELSESCSEPLFLGYTNNLQPTLSTPSASSSATSSSTHASLSTSTAAHSGSPPSALPAKAALTAMNLSVLQNRLDAFLPHMRAANEDLEQERKNGTLGERNIEKLDEYKEKDENPHIEMDLGLGVFEEKEEVDEEDEEEEVEGGEGSDDGAADGGSTAVHLPKLIPMTKKGKKVKIEVVDGQEL